MFKLFTSRRSASATGGCTTDAVEPTEQPNLSSTPPLVENGSTSYTDKVADTLGGYYEETVTFLTDDCGVGGYSVATGKAVVGCMSSVTGGLKTSIMRPFPTQ